MRGSQSPRLTKVTPIGGQQPAVAVNREQLCSSRFVMAVARWLAALATQCCSDDSSSSCCCQSGAQPEEGIYHLLDLRNVCDYSILKGNFEVYVSVSMCVICVREEPPRGRDKDAGGHKKSSCSRARSVAPRCVSRRLGSKEMFCRGEMRRGDVKGRKKMKSMMGLGKKRRRMPVNRCLGKTFATEEIKIETATAKAPQGHGV